MGPTPPGGAAGLNRDTPFPPPPMTAVRARELNSRRSVSDCVETSPTFVEHWRARADQVDVVRYLSTAVSNEQIVRIAKARWSLTSTRKRLPRNSLLFKALAAASASSIEPKC